METIYSSPPVSIRVGQRMSFYAAPIGARLQHGNTLSFIKLTNTSYRREGENEIRTDHGSDGYQYVLLAEPVVELKDCVESKFGVFWVDSIDERGVVRGYDGPSMKYKCHRDEIISIIEKGAK